MNHNVLSTVLVDSSESEHEREVTSQTQSDSVFCETASKEIEVVPTKSGERKRIRCNENSDEVKRFCYRGRVPPPLPICSPTGTEESISEVKVNRVKGLSSSEKIQAIPLLKIANAQTHLLANRIGKLIIQVYNDAKNLSISAFSWPLISYCTEVAQNFDYNNPFEEYDSSVFDLQYVTPASHQKRFKIIVQANLPRFKEEIDDCLAASFRCDASMDRTHKDTEFMLLNVINKHIWKRTTSVCWSWLC